MMLGARYVPKTARLNTSLNLPKESLLHCIPVSCPAGESCLRPHRRTVPDSYQDFSLGPFILIVF